VVGWGGICYGEVGRGWAGQGTLSKGVNSM